MTPLAIVLILTIAAGGAAGLVFVGVLIQWSLRKALPSRAAHAEIEAAPQPEPEPMLPPPELAPEPTSEILEPPAEIEELIEPVEPVEPELPPAAPPAAGSPARQNWTRTAQDARKLSRAHPGRTDRQREDRRDI